MISVPWAFSASNLSSRLQNFMKQASGLGSQVTKCFKLHFEHPNVALVQTALVSRFRHSLMVP